VETIKSTILGVLQNQKHIRTLTQIWETQQTTHRVPCTLEIKTTVVFTFLLRLPLHHPSHTSPGKGPVESRLAHRLDPSRWSDCGCSGNLGPSYSHVHLQTNRCSGTCVRRRGRKGEWRRSSDRGRKRGQGSGRRGGCIFIRQGAIMTMEHLFATMVSLPGSPLSVGQATVIIFLYRLLTLMRGPDTIFSELKLDSLNIIRHKQQQKIRKNYE
jgi:hypothetical protein